MATTHIPQPEPTAVNGAPARAPVVEITPDQHTQPPRAATSLELVGRIINDLSDLVDKQIELAKQEIRDNIGEALGDVKRLAIGAGVAAAVGLLLLIGVWVAIIFWLSWLFAWLLSLTGVGWLPPIGGFLGWIVALLIPVAVGYFIGWKRFIQPGLAVTKIRPLARTRATLKEDLEWVRTLRTPSAR